MSLDAKTLRTYAPLLILVVTVGLGWMVFVRPVSADRARADVQLTSLRQREMTLRRELSDPSPRASGADPAASFEQHVAAGNASPALLEQVARLASAARARNLLIETVEGTATTPGAPPQAPQHDPRFALFDVPVSHVPIRVAFDSDYASLGGFLWAFRDLPTTVEIRALSIGVPPAEPGDVSSDSRPDGLRASLTLHAYSRQVRAVVRASNTVTR
jgi:hypothetical protein